MKDLDEEAPRLVQPEIASPFSVKGDEEMIGEDIYIELPEWLLPFEDWIAPEWRVMDGGKPSVYALDVERSIRAKRPLCEEAW